MTFAELNDRKEEIREYTSKNENVLENAYQVENASDAEEASPRELTEEDINRIASLTWSA